jgi:lipopolysaccharide transport system permease protein
MKPIIIVPRPSWSFQDLSEMIEFRWVFFMLILRDIKLRYKQTYLGILWVILQPLMTALLFAIVFGKWMKLSSDGIPYFLFAFCALIPWLVFSQSIQRASTSLINETHLIQKIYFPRLFLPLSGTFGVVIDFLMVLGLCLVFLPFFGRSFHLQMLFLPLWAALLFGFASGFNILLSCLSAHYRDFKHIVPFFLQFWMYASPLAYSSSIIPEKWQLLFCMNPLTGLIDLFRWSLLGLSDFPVTSFVCCLAITVVLLSTSLILFRKLEHTFADVI